MKRPAKQSSENNSSIRMSLTSDDIKTLYLSNEKYARDILEICAHMSEKDRLIILSLANTLAIMSPDKEIQPQAPVRHRRAPLRGENNSIYLHGVA